MYFFFFNDTATTEIYTLSLHDALPIWERSCAIEARSVPEREAPADAGPNQPPPDLRYVNDARWGVLDIAQVRSEEHTSELQSPDHLVCRLLLEKKKQTHHTFDSIISPT